MAKSKLFLAEIKDLGGTKADLELLKDVDEESVSDLEFEEPSSTKDAEYDQIGAFIESIGLKTDTSVRVMPKKEDGMKTKKSKKSMNNSIQNRRSKEESKYSPEVERRLLKMSTRTYKKLLAPVESGNGWFEQSKSEASTSLVSPPVLNHMTRIGEELMKAEVELYEKVRLKSKGQGDVRWLKTVLSSGTLSDKVAALTLLIQESPVHTLQSLDSLLAMASKKGKRESIMAADTLKELWITDLLPEDRKLKSMKQRPLHALVEESSDRVAHMKLLLWYYEDQLKTKFAKFLSIVKALSHDPVAKIREKMLGYVFDLLYHKPEQEQELLSQLVNKLGDPVKKVASKSVLFLLKLLNHHVNMKTVVSKQLEHLLHRPNISPRAQYYAVCTLNQFIITPGDLDLASQLIETYFTFFKVFSTKKELDAKMLAALLTGVNRAFPFVQGEIPSLDEHLQSLFKVVHIGPLATGIQSLMLLYQVMESHQAVSGRYYQALYAKMLDPQLKHSGKQAIFLNLLFKSLKSDPETNRVKAFLKRMLQVCSNHAPPFVCGSLFLISEVLKLRSILWSFILQPEASDEEFFTDVKEAPLEEVQLEVERSKSTAYQMGARNPLYCRAETSCLWELAKLQTHYHPSVQAFSRTIAAGEYIQYHGDPLQDFTLMRFLDRFVCKNPKQKTSDGGGSLMQRTSRLIKSHQNEVTVNSAQFANLEESKVREDELFMHKYFVQKVSYDAKVNKKKKEVERKQEDKSEDYNKILDLGTVSDKMDFAGELERHSKMTSSKKKKRDVESEEDSDEGNEEDSDEDDKEESVIGEEMSEGDGELESEGLSSGEDSLLGDGGGEVNATEEEMEKLLLENMSSSAEEEEGEEFMQKPAKKRRKRKADDVKETDKSFDSSMFAAAEEFAHLLEESASTTVDRYRGSIKKYHTRKPTQSRTKAGGSRASIKQKNSTSIKHHRPFKGRKNRKRT